MSWPCGACGAGFAALAGSLGLATPGAHRPKDKGPPQSGKKPLRDHRFVCACVRYPPSDGTLIDGNCGETVRRHGRVKKGHEGGEGYDREAILMRDRIAHQVRRRQMQQQRANDELKLLASLMDDDDDSNRGWRTLAQIVTEIKHKHADVLSGRKYAVYAGISKSPGEYAKTLRGEPGRFLWESWYSHKKSTNIPMVQWSASWYDGRMSLNRGDLQWHGFETRVVHISRRKANAALVEKAIQGACAV